jgi:formate C-acetyltransferase
MIELFVNDDTPDDIWRKAFEVIRTNNGQPAFYNENAIMKGLKAKFPVIRDEDLKKFCGGGCTEAMLAGLSNVGSLDAGINLLLILEIVLYEKLESSKTFNDFYNYYITEVRAVVESVTTEISNSQRERAKYNPLPLRTLLVDDCIDNGIEFNNGGARYKWSIINFAGMINVIDAMLVIRDFIFEEKLYNAEEFVELLQTNNKELLEQARNHKISFGNDNRDANIFTNKLSSDIFSMLDDKKPHIGEGFLPASIQFMSQVSAGIIIGATPDGREKGAPLCDSLGAIFGKDTEGPTALLKSVTSLDLKRALGIPVLNFNIKPDFDDATLKALISGYMKLGGIQMQITCTSAQTLMEAYENPDLHKNLVVRVGGYSEYFQKLSDDLKKMVINRTIQKMV